MHIVPFEVSHVDDLASRWPDTEAIGALGADQSWAVACAEAGPAITIFVDGKPIAAAGVAVLWPGVGEAWTIVTPRAENAKLAFHKAVRRSLDDVQNHLPLSRVQAVVRADYERSQRWIERLGFANEGLMKNYGPEGADYYRYGRVR